MVLTTLGLSKGNTEALDIFDTITHMAFGDNATTPTEAQTNLGNEILRVEIQLADITKDTINNTYEFIGRIPITQFNSNDIKEIGLFDASVSGNMLARILSPIIVTKTSNDEILYTIKIKVNTINN